MLSSDFPALNDLNSFNSLSGLNELDSLISQKYLLSFMFPSTLAPKWPILVFQCGMDHQNPLFYWFLATFLLEAVKAIPWDQN